jgi:hypothetical protein
MEKAAAIGPEQLESRVKQEKWAMDTSDLLGLQPRGPFTT